MLMAIATVGIVSIAGIGYIHYINATVAATEREDAVFMVRERDNILDPIMTSEEAERHRRATTQ